MLNRTVVALAFILIAHISRQSEAITYHPTGDTGADCSECGIFPWDSTCRYFYGDPGTVVKQGFYREYNGRKGSQECHSGEDPLPLTAPVEFAMAQTVSYTKEGSAGWSAFGLAASAGTETTISTTVFATLSCNTTGCCLVPRYAYKRFEYKQMKQKLYIARTYYFMPNNAAPHYSGWDPCQVCNTDTRQLSSLFFFPSPELLSYQPATYDNGIYATSAAYCAAP